MKCAQYNSVFPPEVLGTVEEGGVKLGKTAGAALADKARTATGGGASSDTCSSDSPCPHCKSISTSHKPAACYDNPAVAAKRAAKAAEGKTKPGFKGECHHCGKKGHMARDCRKKKAEEKAGTADKGKEDKSGSESSGTTSGTKGAKTTERVTGFEHPLQHQGWTPTRVTGRTRSRTPSTCSTSSQQTAPDGLSKVRSRELRCCTASAQAPSAE